MSPNGPAEPLHVACAVEGEAYLRHCATMLHSLLSHHPGAPIRIDCLHCGDNSPRSRARIADMVRAMGSELTFHQVSDHWVSGLPVNGFTGKATWYRISLDRLLPDADRVLFLDVDLLVRDSLAPLWAVPLQGAVVAAVTNVPPPEFRAYTERPELGGDRYFNAGVLVIDLAQIRRDGVGDELRAFARANAARLQWRDQDALNEVLHGRRLPLHPRWNFMNSMAVYPQARDYFDQGELEKARRHPAIRHFEGPGLNKPWHLLCDPAMRRLYARHRAQTPWRRAPVAGATPMNLGRLARRRFGYM
ncbi:MAG: glycosyltransferase family 8 protein [Actinomycetota bacterium]|nr:glycosyltransferase family 8 protein [Actinomycetota bacterium]